MDSASAANGGAPVAEQPWRLKDIQWRKLMARQDYANFLLTVCLIVAAAVTASLATAHVVPYLLWDARISYPLQSDTIPAWVAVLIPLLMLLITVVVGEFLASRRSHASVTDAVSTTIYFFLDGVQAFICGIMLCEVFKNIVGRLRPNFIARCQPSVPGNVVVTLANITSALNTQFACTGTESGVDEGRKAFPSGHTTAAFNLTVYLSAYLIWVWHWRHPAPRHRLSFGQEFVADFVNVLAKAWMLGCISFAWGVGISRIIDYQHDPSDVVGGAVLGSMIAIVYIMRAIPRWRRVLCQDGTAVDAVRGTATSGDVEMPMMAGHSAKQAPTGAMTAAV